MTNITEDNATYGQDAFDSQLAAKVPGKATCVEAWPREADGDRLLVGLAEGTLLVLAPADYASPHPAGQNASSAGSSGFGSALQHAESVTGNTLGGGTAVSQRHAAVASSGLITAAVNGLTGAAAATAAAASAVVGGVTPSSSSTKLSSEGFSPANSLPWRVRRAFRSFGGGKLLLQMQLLPARGVLLSLCDQGISVHRVPSFQLTCQANRVRNGKCFAWQEGRALLCCAVKRRVTLLHYDGKDLLELKELLAAHSPVAMMWLSKHILLAFHTGYTLLDSESGEQTSLATMIKGTTPAFAVLAGGELLLSLEGHCQIHGADGRPTKRVVTWSAQPTSFIFSAPLLAALLPTRLEVRSLRSASKGRVLQTVAAEGLTSSSSHATRDGARFAVSHTEVWQLRPVPLLQQVEQLASQNRVEEALDLLSLCHSSDQASHREALEDVLHVQLGHQLFRSGAFEEAMAHFEMCRSANPVVLLRLFPSLAPARLLSPVANIFPEYEQTGDVGEPTGDNYTSALNLLLPYLLSWRTRLEAAATEIPPQEEFRDEVASRPDNSDHTTASRSADKPKQPHVLTGLDTEASLSQEAEEGAAALGDSGPVAAAAARDLTQLSERQRHSLAVLLDVAVLKAMLALSDTGQLLRFVRNKNHVDLETGSSALREAGRYAELVALLRGKGCHDEALRLLQQLSQSPQEFDVPPTGAASDLVGMPGVWAAIQYMMAVGPLSASLIRRHSRWVLEADGEAGVDMLAHMEPPIEPAEALRIVSDYAPHLVISYLEAAIKSGAAAHKEFDTPLALSYLKCVLGTPGTENAQPQQPQQGALSSEHALERLKALVLSSQHIDADRLLKQLPSKGLLELRALLLEHFHYHEQILRIYVDELQQPALAEAYCDRVYSRRLASLTRIRYENGGNQDGTTADADAAADAVATAYEDACDSPGEIYLQLLQVFLQPQTVHDGTQDTAGKLTPESQEDMTAMLSRKHDRLDASRALQLLPGEMALATAQKFLVAALQGRGESQRSASIVRSLQRSSNLAARSQLIARRQRSLVVTEERACGVCFKRVGTAAVVAFPIGHQLQHYSCYLKTSDQSELAPITPYS